MSADVDAYINRSKKWHAETTALRPILLASGLDETIKWGKPCYGHNGSNIAIIQEMKDFVALMFFKGALLSDPEGVLTDQGPNSRSAKRIEFTSVADVTRRAGTVTALIAEAIRVENEGPTVAPAPEPTLVDELKERLAADPTFRAAFGALTPGRRREYNLHIAEAKQPATRVARIDKCAPRILAGRGLRDR